MNIGIAVLAGLIGYLLGSISFTRIIGRWVAPGEDLSSTSFGGREGRSSFEMKSVSATSLAIRKGPKVGCFTSLLDILKAFLPTLAFWYFFPGEFYYLIASAAAVAGHNFPVYYGFKGGRGMSPLYGGLLVIDWLAIPVTAISGVVFGVVILRDLFWAYTAGIIFLIPWLWFRFDHPAYVIYAIVVNILFWVAIWPEFSKYLEGRRNREKSDVNLRDYMKSARGMWLNRSTEADPASDEVDTENG